MINSDNFYSTFIIDYLKEVDNVRKRISLCRKKRGEIIVLISKIKNWMYFNTDTNYYSLKPFKNYKTAAWNSKKLILDNIVIKDSAKDSPHAIYLAKCILSLKRYYIAETMLREEYKKKVAAIPSSKAFKALLAITIQEINRLIMFDGYKDFTFGHFTSKIFIKVKDRMFRESTDYNNKVINWGESNQIKESIVKTLDEPLYRAYKKKEISRKDFDIASKKYLYNEQDNPTGHKWIMYYTDDRSIWWWWNKSNCKIRNKISYCFIPPKGNLYRLAQDGIEYEKINEMKGKVPIDKIHLLHMGNHYKLRLYLAIDPLFYRKYL
jgi:hypothetical protein